MKILLVEDFSGYHNVLKEGINAVKPDEEVTLITSRDGWKQIGGDGILLRNGAIPYIIDLLKNKNKLVGYDVVQFINPVLRYELPLSPIITKYFYKKILQNNKSSHLVIAGGNSFMWNKISAKAYSPYEDFRRSEMGGKKFWWEKKRFAGWNRELSRMVNSVIPDGYDYRIGYEEEENLGPIIPCPVNTDKIKYADNCVNGKLKIFHGVSRYGFKGTKYISKAFDIINKKYPNDVDCFMMSGLPYQKYVELLKDVNVILDETSLYAPYMNATLAMAMGKVVMGGSEKEYLEFSDYENSPVINIRPNVDYIVKKIEKIIASKNRIAELGHESRIFVEKYHSHRKIANDYLAHWRNYL